MLSQSFFHMILSLEMLRSAYEEVIKARPYDGMHVEEYKKNVGYDTNLSHYF